MVYICHGALILLKAISCDVLVTQSANVYDIKEVLKLQFCISVYCTLASVFF